MTLTACDKDCDLLAGLKANFIIITALSWTAQGKQKPKKETKRWICCLTPAVGQVLLCIYYFSLCCHSSSMNSHLIGPVSQSCLHLTCRVWFSALPHRFSSALWVYLWKLIEPRGSWFQWRLLCFPGKSRRERAEGGSLSRGKRSRTPAVFISCHWSAIQLLCNSYTYCHFHVLKLIQMREIGASPALFSLGYIFIPLFWCEWMSAKVFGSVRGQLCGTFVQSGLLISIPAAIFCYWLSSEAIIAAAHSITGDVL